MNYRIVVALIFFALPFNYALAEFRAENYNRSYSPTNLSSAITHSACSKDLTAFDINYTQNVKNILDLEQNPERRRGVARNFVEDEKSAYYKKFYVLKFEYELKFKDCLSKKAKNNSEKKSKKLKKKNTSMNSPANNERVRFVENTLKKKRWISLEDLTDKEWHKYEEEILQYVPKAELKKYAPEWLLKKTE